MRVTEMNIRPANDGDWLELWPIWQAVMAAGDSYPFAPDADEETGRQHWMQPPPTESWVAVDDAGTVLGSYISGPNKPGLGDHVATASYIVAPSARRQGIGRALGEHSLERARQRGFASMQFNAVVETNTAAVALWQSLGFTIIGTVPAAHRHPEHGLVGIHIMHRTL